MNDPVSIVFRSESQKEAFRSLAEESGLSFSEWVRRACQAYARETAGLEVPEVETFVPRGHLGYSAEVYSSGEYRALEAAKQRCDNPKAKGHEYYRSKGIKVHELWYGPDGFKRFIEHIGAKPSSAHTLERIENSRGYEPGNVRWATRAEQLRNTSRTRLMTLNGETLCLTDWANRYGLRETTLRSRLQRGVELSEALTMPKGQRKRRAA
jgi:hypothetical protein